MRITYRGKSYLTIKALAEAYTVDYEQLCKMLRDDWTVEDAMKVCRNEILGKGKLYEFEGRVYRSSKRMAEDLGLPWNSLSHFLSRCDSVEEAVKRCREQQENRIVLWGRKYQDRQEVAKMFGLKYSAIAYGMNCKKMSLEEVVLDLLKREPIQFVLIGTLYYAQFVELFYAEILWGSSTPIPLESLPYQQLKR